ncbi:N-acetylmuramoyl-L-alanine amidase [Archangium sp.]|uniref:N-acetylmuramoyl-L-alanine amidase n=1 Tax=Archangium sp. TaxID=1872627 RepID=UPI002D6C5ED3|nr:N-acetylmuramoyl-L-alanine amidase [Archangium sp.]HYO52457.1 N-acetylmuramoyl-L-alanine amidase [Archangium sp.]
MLPRLVLLLALLLPIAVRAKRDEAETAYQEARRSYYALKDDAARRKLRHHWLKVAHKFESVASNHPKSQRAPDALYTAAELLDELSRISFVAEDQRAAIADYTRVMESHPRHRLADDAALTLARLYFERLDEPESARRVITRSLAANPQGDRVRDLKALLASLPPPARTPDPAHGKAPARAPEPPAPVPVPAVASTQQPSRPVIAEQVPVIRVDLSKPADPDEALASNKPVTTPVDEHVAQARLKAVARLSNSAELTLAEQLGLKVRRVVIDAGHGGHDTGAIGREGTQEKEVTLAIAQKLARELRDRGLEVMLTRDDDRYLKLEERARMANEMKGDLFISIHCNSAPTSKLRGIETYTLNTSADRYSIRLAARENASSEKGISDLQFILADLATKANTEESTRLATRVQKNLVSHLSGNYKGVKNLGTKEALFYVLLGAKMPAILVETSFLSHPEEEKRLASETYQEDVAQAIAHGVEDFLGRRQLAKAQVD